MPSRKSDSDPLDNLNKAIRNLKIAVVFASLAVICEVVALVVKLT